MFWKAPKAPPPLNPFPRTIADLMNRVSRLELDERLRRDDHENRFKNFGQQIADTGRTLCNRIEEVAMGRGAGGKSSDMQAMAQRLSRLEDRVANWEAGLCKHDARIMKLEKLFEPGPVMAVPKPAHPELFGLDKWEGKTVRLPTSPHSDPGNLLDRHDGHLLRPLPSGATAILKPAIDGSTDWILVGVLPAGVPVTRVEMIGAMRDFLTPTEDSMTSEEAQDAYNRSMSATLDKLAKAGLLNVPDEDEPKPTNYRVTGTQLELMQGKREVIERVRQAFERLKAFRSPATLSGKSRFNDDIDLIFNALGRPGE